ncbi:hypothetical protein RND71_022872 [Anisodus tanguticus]|uniref:Uncharacterized protein n=1 Tax=Anisodus tanguticus TaxID=243964 RepID=A0AAE1V6H7_9SOLA|nr:hypothetical protein RND71_022872 [Anisodus tanguticus]
MEEHPPSNYQIHQTQQIKINSLTQRIFHISKTKTWKSTKPQTNPEFLCRCFGVQDGKSIKVESKATTNRGRPAIDKIRDNRMVLLKSSHTTKKREESKTIKKNTELNNRADE